jgi:hypothetical protein
MFLNLRRIHHRKQLRESGVRGRPGLVHGRRAPVEEATWGAIHQLLNIILQLRILVLLFVSTLPYVLKVKNYS